MVKNQPIYNEFWGRANTIEIANEVDVPAIHYGGWYDPFLQGTIDAYISRQMMAKKARKASKSS